MPNAVDNAFLADAGNALASGDFWRARDVLAAHRHAVVNDYGAAVKFARLAKKLPAEGAGLRPLKVALIATTATQFFEPLLVGMGAAYGLALDVRTGDFGSCKRAVLDGNSWLYAECFDAVVIAPHHRDARLPSFSENPDADAAHCAREFEVLWATLKSRMSAAVFQYDFDMPALAGADLLAAGVGGHADLLRRANLCLRERARANGVDVVDVSGAGARFGWARWEDARLWFYARQHPAPAALPALALEVARTLRARFVAPKKVCVVDLDNTLWGGVVGEDGAQGVVLGAPDARGEAFVAFQSYLKTLKARGVLLAVCSKNNEADALEPFETRTAMALKREDFVSFKANWLPKSENLRAMAQSLNLGLDSFVFVDDNPAEVAEVAAALPQVARVLLPEDPADYAAALARGEFFDTLEISADDAARTRAYAENRAREQAREKSGNLDEFLASLHMRATVLPLDAARLARAGQLAGKTNQFNLTTRRETPAELAAFAREDGAYAACFRLKDDFGDSGIVGVALARPAGDALRIETFLLSCRALGRGLERFMLDDIAAFARARGLRRLVGLYAPTPKNAPAKDFYAQCGFTRADASAVGGAPETWVRSLDGWAALPHAIARAED